MRSRHKDYAEVVEDAWGDWPYKNHMVYSVNTIAFANFVSPRLFAHDFWNRERQRLSDRLHDGPTRGSHGG